MYRSYDYTPLYTKTYKIIQNWSHYLLCQCVTMTTTITQIRTDHLAFNFFDLKNVQDINKQQFICDSFADSWLLARTTTTNQTCWQGFNPADLHILAKTATNKLVWLSRSARPIKVYVRGLISFGSSMGRPYHDNNVFFRKKNTNKSPVTVASTMWQLSASWEWISH